MSIIITILGLAVLILVHELGHFLMAKIFKVKVEEFGFGLPPRLFYKKGKETIYSFNLLPFGGFVKLFGEDDEKFIEIEKRQKELSLEELKRSYFYQPIYKKFFIVAAGVIMNILFAWLIFSFIFFIGSESHLLIGDVLKNSPAEKIGLKSNDLILQVQFKDIFLKDPVPLKDFVNLVSLTQGEELVLKIKRENKVLDFQIKPEFNEQQGKYLLGVSLVETGFKKTSFFKSFYEGAKFTFFILKELVLGLYKIVLMLVKGTGEKILESITGPIGVVVLTSQIKESFGLIYFLYFLALISLNLAIINFLPFPALDGGRAFLLLIEKIKGKNLSLKFQIILNGIGFVLLLILIILVTLKDIKRFLF